MEKSLANIKRNLSDPMFFVSTFCLIGLCVSAVRRRNPYQKYEAFLAEWKDENMLSNLLHLSHELGSKLTW